MNDDGDDNDSTDSTALAVAAEVDDDDAAAAGGCCLIVVMVYEYDIGRYKYSSRKPSLSLISGLFSSKRNSKTSKEGDAPSEKTRGESTNERSESRPSKK